MRNNKECTHTRQLVFFKIAHFSATHLVFILYLRENGSSFMRKRTENNSHGTFFGDDALISVYRTYKRTIQEYVLEVMRHNRYQSTVNYTNWNMMIPSKLVYSLKTSPNFAFPIDFPTAACYNNCIFRV